MSMARGATLSKKLSYPRGGIRVTHMKKEGEWGGGGLGVGGGGWGFGGGGGGGWGEGGELGHLALECGFAGDRAVDGEGCEEEKKKNGGVWLWFFAQKVGGSRERVNEGDNPLLTKRLNYNIFHLFWRRWRGGEGRFQGETVINLRTGNRVVEGPLRVGEDGGSVREKSRVTTGQGMGEQLEN